MVNYYLTSRYTGANFEFKYVRKIYVKLSKEKFKRFIQFN